MKRFMPLLLLAAGGRLHAADTAPAVANTSGTGAVIQMLGALALVLAVLFAVLWLLRRVSGGRLNGTAPIRTVGGIALGSRERVVLLEIGEHWLVVGVAPGSVTGIATLPRGELAGQGGDDSGVRKMAPDFGALLARLKAGRP
ncbi:MAG TPA: flagellar biosynthetic protein FliO [Methyloversatilis sp.]